jgi:DNA gyrase/topoisomerase IV subunit A
LSSAVTAIFFSSQHVSILVSSVFGVLLAPAAAFQQRKLTETVALKETNERLQEEVAQLEQERARLDAHKEEMTKSVTHLQQIEQTYATVSAIQGDAVKELEKQLAESEEILASMHRNQAGDILQNLVSILLATDKDRDMKFSDEEVEDLIRQLEGLHGVELKEDLLRKTVKEQGGSVAALLELARHVLSPDIPPDQNIFSYIEGNKREVFA